MEDKVRTCGKSDSTAHDIAGASKKKGVLRATAETVRFAQITQASIL